MAKQTKGNGKVKAARTERQQVVLKVPPALKATMVKAAHAAGISANAAWIIRCTTGAMPKPRKED